MDILEIKRANELIDTFKAYQVEYESDRDDALNHIKKGRGYYSYHNDWGALMEIFDLIGGLIDPEDDKFLYTYAIRPDYAAIYDKYGTEVVRNGHGDSTIMMAFYTAADFSRKWLDEYIQEDSNPVADLWEFIMEWYPNYHSSQEIADSDTLRKILDNEYDPEDPEDSATRMLNTCYGGNPNNPQIAQDLIDLDAKIVLESIRTFKEHHNIS